MGITVRIEENSVDVINRLSAMSTNQLPFVMAKTLTGLAFDVRDIETQGLKRYFKQRTKWTNRSIKVVRAEKRDYPDQSAIVGVRDKVLALNITGGTKEGPQGIPGPDARKVLNPAKETLGPPRFPGRVIGKKVKKFGNKAFVFTSKKGRTVGKTVVAVRRTKQRTPIDTLYTLTDKVQLKKKWPMVENARKIVKERYSDKLRRNLISALR